MLIFIWYSVRLIAAGARKGRGHPVGVSLSHDAREGRP